MKENPFFDRLFDAIPIAALITLCLIAISINIDIMRTRREAKAEAATILENPHDYLPGKPDRWGMTGSQDRYSDWPYPPLRTNITQYFLIPHHGIAYVYFCNDGQLRWSFKPLTP